MRFLTSEMFQSENVRKLTIEISHFWVRILTSEISRFWVRILTSEISHSITRFNACKISHPQVSDLTPSEIFQSNFFI